MEREVSYNQVDCSRLPITRRGIAQKLNFVSAAVALDSRDGGAINSQNYTK
jgi:hypothetical protein